MGDYATDRRGDVGSWVREVAMEATRLVTEGRGSAALHLNLSKHPAGQVIVAILEAQRTLATQDKFLRQQRAG